MQATHKQYKIYIDRTPADTWRYFADPDNQQKILPSAVPPECLTPPEAIEPEARFTLRIYSFGKWREMQVGVAAVEPDVSLECRQIDGPFDSAAYRFRVAPFQAGTLVTEQIEYRLKNGIGSRLWNRLWLDEQMDRFFMDRQQAAKRLMESMDRAE